MNLRYKLLAGIGAVAIAALAAQAQVPGVNSTLQSVFTLAYEVSTMKPSYSSAIYNVPASSATDICTIHGSATKQIRVRRAFFSGVATTAITDPVALVKRSTANQAGTGYTGIIVPHDSANPTGTATVEQWTTNPTLGTLVGVITDPMYSFGNLTTGGAATFGSRLQYGELAQPIVLRGIAQNLALNLNGITYSGGLITCGFEWTEE